MRNSINISAYPLFVMLFLMGCQNKSPKQSINMLIANANVIHLETGEIEVQDIYIANGRIKALATAGSDTNYKAETTVDATGKFMLPGFWDNHTHLRGGDSLVANNKNFLKLFIANGITTIRDAGGDLTSSVMEWKQEIADGNLVGPTIFTSGPKIDGPGATWAGSLEVENEDDIATALDSLEKLNVDFVKLYDSRILGEHYLKTIKEAEARGLIVSGHMPFTVTLDETVDAGIDAIEHLYYIMKGCANNEIEITEKLKTKEIGFWQAMPALMTGYADSKAQKTFQKLKEHNVFVVPTLHIGKTLSYLDEVDHWNDAYLKYIGQGIIKTYQGRIDRALNASEKTRTDRKDLDTFFGQLCKSLNDAGVDLLAGSDSGAYNSYTYPGISLHGELKAMVDNGISPLEALKTSAPNGAKFLNKSGDFGSIYKGKVADLVLLDANPLEKIENTQKIYAVLKGDRLFNKEQLATLLKASEIN
ncbi:amidohydrolase [Flagellimonas aquimarina]|uniref:Amidohydrolase n=1 Tax=Flagellimonas aquimarina TaxID=2201895 RepID=A0A316KXU0_9FLAO|nr:amidohydrolase family protein [Allomuricauda koreensis]PWL38476.1 amidohydrolase [Allomuricauda koreensis]